MRDRLYTAGGIFLLWFLLSASSCVETTITLVVGSVQKISDTAGGLNTGLTDNSGFGSSLSAIGDLNGDDAPDLAVGAPGSMDGGAERGAVWILFANGSGSVIGSGIISSTQGAFAGDLDDGDRFGSSVASLGDLNGDGNTDIAVGAPFDDDGGTNKGAVWILFLDTDGSVTGQQKISETTGGFAVSLDADDFFGTAVATIGDLDGDGITDLAVTAPGDDDGGTDFGAVWILFMDANGAVKAQSKISSLFGSFNAALTGTDDFARSVAAINDFNGDGVRDIAVGAPLDDTGGADRGAAWLLFLNRDGTVRSQVKIAHQLAGFDNGLADGDRFGSSMANIGDLDGDGSADLAVGAENTNLGSGGKGATWILFMENANTVFKKSRISERSSGVSLDEQDLFGRAVANIGDLDDNGIFDIGIGSPGDDDGGSDRGAVRIFLMNQADTDTERTFLDFGD